MTITIDHIHNGPPGSGHGGVTAGRAAALVDERAAVVRLLAPVPLGAALEPVPVADGAVELHAGSVPIVRVGPLGDPLPAPALPRVTAADAAAAEARFLADRGGVHPFPGCFACGTERPDGLLLRAGPVDDELHATRWTPSGRGEVPPWLVWAALDCPSGAPALAAAGVDDLIVTGELAVQVLAPVIAGELHVIASREASRSGRRIVAEAVLLGPDGAVRAVARATWFVLAAAAV